MSNETNTPAEVTPGWNLLKPISDLPAWDLLDLYADLTELFEGLDKATSDKAQIRAMSSLTRSLIAVAVDADAYTEFSKGSGGLESTVTLAAAWMVELGKSASSVI